MMIASSKEYFGEGIGIVLKAKNFLFDTYITKQLRLKCNAGLDSKYIILLLWVGPFAFEVTRTLRREDLYLKVIEDSLE